MNHKIVNDIHERLEDVVINLQRRKRSEEGYRGTTVGFSWTEILLHDLEPILMLVQKLKEMK